MANSQAVAHKRDAGWWDAPSHSQILAEAINKTIFSSNTVVTFIVFNDSA